MAPIWLHGEVERCSRRCGKLMKPSARVKGAHQIRELCLCGHKSYCSKRGARVKCCSCTTEWWDGCTFLVKHPSGLHLLLGKSITYCCRSCSLGFSTLQDAFFLDVHNNWSMCFECPGWSADVYQNNPSWKAEMPSTGNSLKTSRNLNMPGDFIAEDTSKL